MVDKTKTLIAIIGETTQEAVDSILESGYTEIINVVPEGVCKLKNLTTIVSGDELGFLNLAFSYAKSSKYNYRFIYFMYGFSILNKDILKNLSLEGFYKDACSYSNYISTELGCQSTGKDFRKTESLTSFDPILFRKKNIPVINLLVYIKSVKNFNYTTPYDFVVGEYQAGNIVYHIPEPLFFTPKNPYENLNKDILNKYAKLYI